MTLKETQRNYHETYKKNMILLKKHLYLIHPKNVWKLVENSKENQRRNNGNTCGKLLQYYNIALTISACSIEGSQS